MSKESQNGFGEIHVAVGPMFASKTGWLIYKLENTLYLKHPLLLVTHIKEAQRVGKKILKSRTGKILPAENASSADEIYNLMLNKKLFDKSGQPRVLAIDEMQFFDTKLALLAVEAQKFGINVFAAGLDQYFNEEFCPTSAAMIAVANYVEKLVSGCDVCGKDIATRTQRFVNGQPASYNHFKEIVGDKNPLEDNTTNKDDHEEIKYSARCLRHHIVPGKPNFVK